MKVRVQDLDLRLNRMALSMRSEETARKSARFAMLQNLTHEIFAARVIAVEEPWAVEVNRERPYLYAQYNIIYIHIHPSQKKKQFKKRFQELGADVEVRHPQTGSVLGFLSNSQVKRSKPLQVGEDIEVEPWNHGTMA